MDIFEKISTIHYANFQCNIDDFGIRIRECASEYGLETSASFPAWFHKLVDRVLNRQAEVYLFPEIDSEMYSFILELEDQFCWTIHDEGEWIDMLFPRTRVNVHLSREAHDANGHSCCLCTVTIEEI